MNAEQQAVIDAMMAQARSRSNASLTQPMSSLGQPSNRNYGAMRPEKLKRCIQELRMGAGDAYRRCLVMGGDPVADLAKAEQILASMGYKV